jgi:RNA polymerase sigma-32 factor
VIEKNTVLDDIEKIMDQKEDERLPAKLDSLKAYLALLLKFPLLSLEEEREITRLVYEDHDPCSAERLALSNLKLVVKISMGYNNMYHDILDLIQEGNVGLLHAVKKYNPYKGTKFSTYAQFWIRAYMMKFIMDTWSIVKLGTTQGQRKLFYRLNKERQRLERFGLYPATRIIAQNLQVKEEEVKEMETGLAFNDVYLESPVSDEGSDTMMDLLADDEDVEYVVTEKEKQNVLAKIIKTVTATLNEKEECFLHKRLMADEPF